MFYFNKELIHSVLAKNFDKNLSDHTSSLHKTFVETIKPKLVSVKSNEELLEVIYDSLIRVSALSVHIAVDEVLKILESLNTK